MSAPCAGAPGPEREQDAPRAEGSADDATLAYYDANAADYAQWSRRTEGAESANLTRFLAALPKGGRALDLGCGAGWASAAMIAAGFSVRALDASEGLVAQARAQGVPAEVARFESLDEDAGFDGAWVSYSLLHAPLHDWPDILGRVARALKPGGVLFLGLKEGEGESRDALGRRYSYISAPALEALLGALGFDEVETEITRGTGRDGSVSGMIAAFARRA